MRELGGGSTESDDPGGRTDGALRARAGDVVLDTAQATAGPPMTAPDPARSAFCSHCEPVLGSGRAERKNPYAASKVLEDAKDEEGGLWLGVLEIRAEDVALADLHVRLGSGAQPVPDSPGWVFQCTACDRLGVVVQAEYGGSLSLPVLDWPGAPEPETVPVRPAQLAALFRRITELETRVCELEDRFDVLE
ncbi:hypothetical protein [Streptomyces mirabilis]|uniref:hypothetical protein n=1 Tax=Streptomyces mirabilis TaxID=68239 RepID=UPI003407A0F5